ncbi:MAG: tetratricopeptide repeat protein [Chloroflexota bacterium]|nr:tetratricopeptide repeat protein [Chloroflexota bacterium]
MVTSKKDKPVTRKQLIEDAQRAALEGRWEDAIAVNDQILERSARDVEALNRKGRALLELRRLSAARDAYSEALKTDPANMIARRNLQRLELLYQRPESAADAEDDAAVPLPRGNVFIEEVGRTWVDELANPLPVMRLSEVSPGTRLDLQIADGKLYVTDGNERLGEIETRVARRPIELLEGGNRFEVYALGISGQSLRVIIREVYRDPSQESMVAFPRQIRATQELMRERELLFQRDETDFMFSEDDEDAEPELIESEDEEEAEQPDQDAAAYVEDRAADDEEEDQE